MTPVWTNQDEIHLLYCGGGRFELGKMDRVDYLFSDKHIPGVPDWRCHVVAKNLRSLRLHGLKNRRNISTTCYNPPGLQIFFEPDLVSRYRHVSNNFHDSKSDSNIFRIYYSTIVTIRYHINNSLNHGLLWFINFPNQPLHLPRPAPGPKCKAKGPKQVAGGNWVFGHPNFTEKKGESLLIY